MMAYDFAGQSVGFELVQFLYVRNLEGGTPVPVARGNSPGGSPRLFVQSKAVFALHSTGQPESAAIFCRASIS